MSHEDFCTLQYSTRINKSTTKSHVFTPPKNMQQSLEKLTPGECKKKEAHKNSPLQRWPWLSEWLFFTHQKKTNCNKKLLAGMQLPSPHKVSLLEWKKACPLPPPSLQVVGSGSGWLWIAHWQGGLLMVGYLMRSPMKQKDRTRNTIWQEQGSGKSSNIPCFLSLSILQGLDVFFDVFVQCLNSGVPWHNMYAKSKTLIMRRFGFQRWGQSPRKDRNFPWLMRLRDRSKAQSSMVNINSSYLQCVIGPCLRNLCFFHLVNILFQRIT